MHTAFGSLSCFLHGGRLTAAPPKLRLLHRHILCIDPFHLLTVQPVLCQRPRPLLDGQLSQVLDRPLGLPTLVKPIHAIGCQMLRVLDPSVLSHAQWDRS